MKKINLEYLIHKEQPVVIGLWDLTKRKYNLNFKIDDIIRKDRREQIGRALAFWIRKDLQSTGNKDY